MILWINKLFISQMNMNNTRDVMISKACYNTSQYLSKSTVRYLVTFREKKANKDLKEVQVVFIKQMIELWSLQYVQNTL